jgi:AcrR family transcriptional regulator
VTRPARKLVPDETSRDRIHRIALRLFARYGFEGVSLQDIADDVGLHKSTLFHHYKSKLELVHEVIDAVIEDLLDVARPLIEGGEARLDDFYAAIDRLVDHFSEQPEAARLLLAAMTAPDDSELRSAPASTRAIELYAAIATWFERARRHGAIRALNIRQAIPNLVGLVLAYPAVAHDLGELVGPEPFAPRAREIRKKELRHILAGMMAP